jgi:Domain of unknown function (DUF4337)
MATAAPSETKTAALGETKTAAESGGPEHPSHRWHEHVPRTTAVLAVLAAVASGSYAGQFSKTILAQAEASDQWNYYQAKSIKKHLSQSQYDMAHAMGQGRPDLAEALKTLETSTIAKAKEYDQELKEIKAGAEKIEDDKRRHQKQGDRFQIGFVILQAGVVLSTIAASARRRELWMAALIAGILGLLVIADGFLLIK